MRETYNLFHLLPTHGEPYVLGFSWEAQKTWGKSFPDEAWTTGSGERRREELYTVCNTRVLNWTRMNFLISKSTKKVMESGNRPERRIWQSMVGRSDCRKKKNHVMFVHRIGEEARC